MLVAVIVVATHGVGLSARQTGERASLAPTMAQASVRRLLDTYCVSCHSDRVKTGGLSLQGRALTSLGEDAAIWEMVLRKVRVGLMPPAGQPRPEITEQHRFADWLQGALDEAAAAHPNPGRTEAIHRLNRAEYRNAVRDVLDLDIDVTELLPADDASYGFDNMAGSLKLNQSLLERYLLVATKVSASAVGRIRSPTAEVFRVPIGMPQSDRQTGLPPGTRGGLLIRNNFPADGEYEIVVDLVCTTELDLECDGSLGFTEPHDLEISVDGERVGLFTLPPRVLEDINYPSLEDEGLRLRVPVKAGVRHVAVTFVQTLGHADFVRAAYRKKFERPFRYYADAVAIPMPAVDNVSIRGPFNPTSPGDTASRRRIFTCRPDSVAAEPACARSILESLARRAYRRPLQPTDVDALRAFYATRRDEEGATFEDGIEEAIRALLVSPYFLLRVEREPAGAPPNTNYAVSDLELASRLSFFLWSSVPDDELLDVATNGTLHEPDVLGQQVSRMLADARSKAVIENFAGQWLRLRGLDGLRPVEALFPDFDDSLRDAFRQETEHFLDYILREDRSVVDMLTADYTFVNERLARHYNIPNVTGPRFRRVSLADTPRRGLLGQGSVLAVTSFPTRTSPVVRGKWVLENVFGVPPPPPPPNVPVLTERNDGGRDTQREPSMRERMAEHRRNPACSSCHSMIDPIGFALENFDAIGRWRDIDESFAPIDASGILPDGSEFAELSEFQTALATRAEQFVTTFTAKLLVYALGRGLEPYDQPAVRAIVAEAARADYRISSIINGVVTSLPFHMRRTE